MGSTDQDSLYSTFDWTMIASVIFALTLAPEGSGPISASRESAPVSLSTHRVLGPPFYSSRPQSIRGISPVDDGKECWQRAQAQGIIEARAATSDADRVEGPLEVWTTDQTSGPCCSSRAVCD